VSVDGFSVCFGSGNFFDASINNLEEKKARQNCYETFGIYVPEDAVPFKILYNVPINNIVYEMHFKYFSCLL